jgi:hypothetical protein
MLCGIRPDWCNWIGVFIVDGELMQWSNLQFKNIDVLAVELHKANELGNVLYFFGLRPSG